MSHWTVHHGDLFDVLPLFPEATLDACVTDPPYGIGFMGKKWDTFKPEAAEARIVPNRAIESDNPNLKGRTRGPASSPSAVEYNRSLAGQREFQAWTEQWAREVFRVLKPGAYLLVCGAPRSFHRMTCGLEDAGFEVRDCFSWLYAQGFPKSLNLGDGRGTALKPSWEPIMLARKPLKGTVAANVAQFGTGALNIDGSRIHYQSDADRKSATPQGACTAASAGAVPNVAQNIRREFERPELKGRWPPNVLLTHAPDCVRVGTRRVKTATAVRSSGGGNTFGGGTTKPPMNNMTYACADGKEEVENWQCVDDCPVKMLDAQSGQLSSGFMAAGTIRTQHESVAMHRMTDNATNRDTYADTGGASRFFYVAKPDRAERDQGCETLARKQRDESRKVGNPPARGLFASGRQSLLNTAGVVYADPVWVSEVLNRMRPADMGRLRQRAIGESTILSNDGCAWSMCWCGSPCTDPFHPAIKSIIETEISSTTVPTISNSSPRLHTNGCTAAASGVMVDGGNLAAYAEFQSPWAAKIGTSPKKGGRSTADADLATSVASWLTSKPVGGGTGMEARNFHPT